MNDRLVNDWYKNSYSHGVSSLLSRVNDILQKREFLSSVKKISDQELEIPYSLKPSPFFLEHGHWQWIICIRLDFIAKEVFHKKYSLCVHEVKVALLSCSCFKHTEIKSDGIYIFAARPIWSTVFNSHSDSYNGDSLAKTIINVSTIIDVLDMLFVSRGHVGLKGKIGVLCGKGIHGFEERIFKESMSSDEKIFMDEDAYKLTSKFSEGFWSFYFDEEYCCYRGDILRVNSIDVARNYLHVGGLCMKDLIPENEKDKHYGEILVLEGEKNLLISSICPRCNGDGGAGSGCRKCDGSGWVSETARSSGHCLTEKKDTSNDNSRVSNFDYGDVHQGAHYRDRDGRFGSIPDYDADD